MFPHKETVEVLHAISRQPDPQALIHSFAIVTWKRTVHYDSLNEEPRFHFGFAELPLSLLLWRQFFPCTDRLILVRENDEHHVLMEVGVRPEVPQDLLASWMVPK